MSLSISEIQQAQERIKNIIHKNPLVISDKLTHMIGTPVYLKKENLQLTGSFKIRGAFNKLAAMDPVLRSKGVITSSAGNHGQGVAYAGNYFKIRAVIVMPLGASLLKVNACKSFGAEVIQFGENFDEAYTYSCKLAEEQHLNFIHAFDDDAIIAGQGTLASEMLEELPEITYVLVPVGGGGLISGIASLYKSLAPQVKVIGVTAKGAAAMHNSFKYKRIEKVDTVRTIADGIAIRDVKERTYHYICESVYDIIEVDDDEIAGAVLYLLENEKMVVEGAGATSIAALLYKKITFKPTDKVALVVSGGNIDVSILDIIIQKGLYKTDRRMKFKVIVADRPGHLYQLLKILSDADANIVWVEHNRTLGALSYGDSEIIITADIKGSEHKAYIKKELVKHYSFREVME